MFKQILKQSVYRFKRLQRAGYSAFNSMHRHVTIGRVKAELCDLELLKAGRSVAVCAAVVLPLSATVADDTPPDDALLTQLQLQEVNVMAERSAFQSDVFRLVTNLSAEEISLLPVRTVADLLNYLPGIDLRERGATGVQADLSMRGGTQDQVKVLINGIDMTDSQTGHYTMDIPIDVSLIEKIEVFNGTSYGLGAFSGAINIITRKSLQQQSKSWNLHGALAAGEYGYAQPEVAAQFKKGKWLQNISASYNRSSGYMQNTDYKIANAFVQSQTDNFNIQAGAQFKNAGANSFYSLKYPNQFDATRAAFVSAGYANRWNNWHLSVNAMYRAHFDRFELFRHTDNDNGQYGAAPEWYTADNRHWTHTAAADATAAYIYDWSKTAVSINVRDEYINSSNLGLRNRVNVNYSLEQSFYYNKLNASVGVSGIYNSQFKNDWALGANIGYEPISNLHLFVNANRAVRIPTFTDLYYQSATQIANPLLKPEKAVQTELGINYRRKINNTLTEAALFLYMSATGYYRWGRDIIDWVKEPDPEIVQWKSMNHTAIDAAGTELRIGVEGGEWLQRVEINYSFCHLQKDAGEMLSKYALDYLRHKASLRIEHKIYKGFGASWCLRVEQRNGAFSDINGDLINYSPVVLLDGQVYWQNSYLKASLACKNMTNQSYYDFGGILQPQHWVVGKIEFTL